MQNTYICTVFFKSSINNIKNKVTIMEATQNCDKKNYYREREEKNIAFDFILKKGLFYEYLSFRQQYKGDSFQNVMDELEKLDKEKHAESE